MTRRARAREAAEYRPFSSRLWYAPTLHRRTVGGDLR